MHPVVSYQVFCNTLVPVLPGYLLYYVISWHLQRARFFCGRARHEGPPILQLATKWGGGKRGDFVQLSIAMR